MKKLTFLLIVLSCLPVLSYGQTHFSVSGMVIDSKTKQGIKDVTVRLIGSDKTDLKILSDSAGNYLFTNCFKLNTAYIIVTDVSTIKDEHKSITYGDCPYSWYEDYGYMNSSEKYKFYFSDSLPTQTHIFYLNQAYECGYRFPEFFFKKNSTDFTFVEGMGMLHSDTITDCFVALLMSKKSWVIELSGHSSPDESNKKELAEARAKKLFDLFVSKGIDPKRLVYQSYSDTRPIEFTNEYGAIVKKDRATTYTESRRASVVLLSKDFGLPKPGGE